MFGMKLRTNQEKALAMPVSRRILAMNGMPMAAVTNTNFRSAGIVPVNSASRP